MTATTTPRAFIVVCTLMICTLFAAATTGVVGLLNSSSASAQAQDYAVPCNNVGNRFKPDEVINACSVLIASGKVMGNELAAAYNNRGLGYDLKGDFDRAIADYTEAMHRQTYNDAHSVMFCQNRGDAYYAKGNYGSASSDYQCAIRINQTLGNLRPLPNILPPASLYFKLGLAQYERGIQENGEGYYDQAIDTFTNVIKFDANDASAYFHRGLAHIKKYEFDAAYASLNKKHLVQAVDDFNQSLKIDPSFERAGIYADKYAALLAQLSQPSRRP